MPSCATSNRRSGSGAGCASRLRSIRRTPCCPAFLESFPGACFAFMPSGRCGRNPALPIDHSAAQKEVGREPLHRGGGDGGSRVQGCGYRLKDKLYTLLLAYTMAGVNPLPGVDMSKEAVLSASSVEFIGVPLNMVMACYPRNAFVPSRRLGGCSGCNLRMWRRGASG